MSTRPDKCPYDGHPCADRRCETGCRLDRLTGKKQPSDLARQFPGRAFRISVFPRKLTRGDE